MTTKAGPEAVGRYLQRAFDRYGICSIGLLEKCKRDYGMKLPMLDSSCVDWKQLLEIPGLIHADNWNAYLASVPLLLLFDNIKPFTMRYHREAEVLLRDHFDLHVDTLVNQYRSYPGYRIYREYVYPYGSGGKGDLLQVISDEFKHCLKHIHNNQLLGDNTGSYYSATKYWLDLSYTDFTKQGSPLSLSDSGDKIGLMHIVKKIIFRLHKRQQIQGVRKAEMRSEVIDRLVGIYIRTAIHAFLSFYRQSDWDSLAFTLSDEIAELLQNALGELLESPDKYLKTLANVQTLSNALAVLRPAENSCRVRYVKHNLNFVYLGDKYGDCTANRVREQVDETIANIHWTVYAWLFHPYYRVLEIGYRSGAKKPENVLKAHIVPLIIHGRKILMVDAIETAVTLRQFVRGTENTSYNAKLFSAASDAALETLYEECRRISAELNTEAIYIDKFSNSEWIRRSVSLLDSDSYHIDDVSSPYDLKNLGASVSELVDPADAGGPIRFELQAVNLNLSEQYTCYGYKEVAVLQGLRGNWRLALRGI